MTIGFVLPGPDAGPSPDRLTPAVDHALCALVNELRRRSIPVVVHELAERHWLLPPSAFAESALFLADRLSRCDLVVDLTSAWEPLVRRARRPLNAVPLRRSGLAPWADVTAFTVGNGSGGYVLVDEGIDIEPPADGPDIVRLPVDAGVWERGALYGDAIAFVAGDGPWAGFTAAEAVACGTPVIVRADAPAAEVIDHGVTGLVIGHDPGPDLNGLLAEATPLDRWAGRKTALDRFSVERAVLDLLVLAGRPAVAARPAPSPVGRELIPTAA